MSVTTTSGVRLDKWLWAARFFKTRSLAAEEIHKGRVSVNGTVAKAAREVRIGDTIALRQGNIPKTVQVLGLSQMRGPAPVAQQLYAETPQSQEQRQQLAEQRRLAPEPAAAITEQRQGRPTKRQRRELDAARSDGWGERWSARWEG